PLAPERGVELAVDVDGRLGLLERAGQRDADVRVLRLARAVDHAAHDRDAQLLHARVARPPVGHALADVALDLLGHLLEERAGRPAAARAGRDLRRDAADLERLEDLLRDTHLFRAVAAGPRRERDADRVANALVQQHGQTGGGGDDALGPHARLGQPEVQRVVAPRRQP